MLYIKKFVSHSPLRLVIIATKYLGPFPSFQCLLFAVRRMVHVTPSQIYFPVLADIQIVPSEKPIIDQQLLLAVFILFWLSFFSASFTISLTVDRKTVYLVCDYSCQHKYWFDAKLLWLKIFSNDTILHLLKVFFMLFQYTKLLTILEYICSGKTLIGNKN